MEIYILQRVYWYEGSSILGVFTSKAAAQARLKDEIGTMKGEMKDNDMEFNSHEHQTSLEISEHTVEN